MSTARRTAGTRFAVELPAKLLLVAYAVKTFSTFAVAAVLADSGQEVGAVVIGCVIFGPLTFALARGRRWGWLWLLALDGAVLVSLALEGTNLAGLGATLLGLAILLSPPIRRHVGLEGPLRLPR